MDGRGWENVGVGKGNELKSVENVIISYKWLVTQRQTRG